MKIQHCLILVTFLGFYALGYSQDSTFKAKASQDAKVLGKVGQNRDTSETIMEFDFLASGEMGMLGIAITKDSAFYIGEDGTKDSAFYVENANKGEKVMCTVYKGFKLNKTDWSRLNNSVAGYKLSELVNLTPPTNDGTLDDDVPFSIIEIVTNRSKYFTGSFEDYNPNEKLKKLMTVIQEIEERK